MTSVFRRWAIGVIAGLLLGLGATADSLVQAGSTWSYLKGTQEASPDDSPAWRQLDFNDHAWATGPEPFYYGEPLSGTELPDMRGTYTSVYFRQTFTVANPADVAALTLKVLSDDGFVAWINGEEVARFNVPAGDLSASATALGTFAEPLPVNEFPVGSPDTLLRPGLNVLAIHGFNASLSDSSDFVMDATLEATVDNSAPVVDRVTPTPGSVVPELSSVEIDFSRPVEGVDAADLLVNGVPAADQIEFAPGQFLFTFPKTPTGSVTVAFREGHGITDRASTPHPFAGGSWTFTVNPAQTGPSVVLNEFMADNHRTLRDEDGDAPDWIELSNPDTRAASLTGWYLTDDPATPKKWRFPSVSLPAKSFLVVYASGKNRTNDTTHLHTNFKLMANAGGYLALANAAGEWVSAITNYPAQFTDVSFGLAPGVNLTGYFVDTTPGKPNTASGAGFAPPVEFSEASQTFQGALTLTLATTNPAAVIRYTTNGELPSVTAFVYTDPLTFTNAVQVRAQAYAGGLLPGPVRSETFVPLSVPTAAIVSDLPVLLIHDFNQGRPPANSDTFAFVELFEPGTNGLTSLTNLPTLATRASIAARGSSTLGDSKVNLRMEFQDDLGFGRDLGLLGLPADNDWILYGPDNFEPILIHNPFAHQLSRNIGRYSPRTRFVEVYLVVKGIGAVTEANYYGIYVLEEKIKLGSHRVDEPKLYSGQNTPPQVTGGYLMKIDRPGPGEGGFYAANQSLLYVDPKEEEILQPDRAGQRDYLQRYMDNFGNALYGDQYRNPATGYRAFIDTGSWIDHHLLNVLTFNVDALRLSAYFYKARDGKLHFGPLWDFDRALYSTDGRDANPKTWRSTTSDQGTDFFNYPWWDRLFTDPDFYQDYIDRYQELRRGAFSTNSLDQLVDDLTSVVRREEPREVRKWGVTPRGGYSGEITRLKTWLGSRVGFMDSQFVQPPAFTVPGQVVSNGFALTFEVPPNTSVYYTLDGTDPRKRGTATGDEVAPGAILYGGPIILSANVRVFARGRNPAQVARTGPNNPPLRSIWSGPLVDTFVVKPFPIRVTEIMYHPAGDGPGTGFNDEDYEFLELQNNGPEAVDLNGFTLEGTVDFAFVATNPFRLLAPGARLVLVSNPTAFARRYPGVGSVAGTLSGKLANDSGRLALFGPLREPVFDFSYVDDWQPTADGLGDSLVLREDQGGTLPPGDAASWRASSRFGGSPGAADPAQVRLQATLSGGMLKIAFTGDPGRTYMLQELADPAVPVWQMVESRTAGGDGAVEYAISPAADRRLYRAILQ